MSTPTKAPRNGPTTRRGRLRASVLGLFRELNPPEDWTPTNRAAMMAILPGAPEQKAKLSLDAATGKLFVLDGHDLPLVLESAVFYLRGEQEASYELDVAPGLHLQNAKPDKK